jgi:hypothetical protein
MPKLPDYHKDPRRYYDVLKSLTPDELRQEWKEITARDFDYFLGCVPPLRLRSSSFLVGECATHGERGPIHDACVCITVGSIRRYFKRPAYLFDRDREDYAAEIRKLFNF